MEMEEDDEELDFDGRPIEYLYFAFRRKVPKEGKEKYGLPFHLYLGYVKAEFPNENPKEVVRIAAQRFKDMQEHKRLRYVVTCHILRRKLSLLKWWRIRKRRIEDNNRAAPNGPVDAVPRRMRLHIANIEPIPQEPEGPAPMRVLRVDPPRQIRGPADLDAMDPEERQRFMEERLRINQLMQAIMAQLPPIDRNADRPLHLVRRNRAERIQIPGVGRVNRFWRLFHQRRLPGQDPHGYVPNPAGPRPPLHQFLLPQAAEPFFALPQAAEPVFALPQAAEPIFALPQAAEPLFALPRAQQPVPPRPQPEQPARNPADYQPPADVPWFRMR